MVLSCGVLLVACGAPTPRGPAPQPSEVATTAAPPDDAAPDAGAPPPERADAGASAPPPATTKPPSVEVAFAVRPIVGPGVPVLRVRLTNSGTTPVRYARFANAACFAASYLKIALVKPDGKPATPPLCQVDDWPGTDAELAPGGVATIELPFDQLFGKLGPGIYSLEVDWDTSWIESTRPDLAIGASQWSLDGDRFAIARPLSTFRIQRGASVTLPRGGRLTFKGHGHKRTYPGQESPLMIHGTLEVGKTTTEVSVSLMTSARRWFQVEGRVFELVGHAYDEWMELAYYGPLALE